MFLWGLLVENTPLIFCGSCFLCAWIDQNIQFHGLGLQLITRFTVHICILLTANNANHLLENGN